MAGEMATWWHGFVACPSCSSPKLIWPDSSRGRGECRECRISFQLIDNVLNWEDGSQGQSVASSEKLSLIIRRIRSLINPISSHLLPFRYLTKNRLENYYLRTLHDTRLARKWAQHYLDGLDLPVGATVLDFGCGRGRNIGILNQLGYDSVGQDIFRQQWWGELLSSGFQVVKKSRFLPWRTKSFDLVVQVQVVNYLNETQLRNHFEYVRHILKSGGIWLLIEPNENGFGARHIRKHYGRMHSLNSLKMLAELNGFKEVDLKFEGFYAPFFPMTINFLRKQCNPRPFDLSDNQSFIASHVEPEKRGFWILRLRRVGE